MISADMIEKPINIVYFLAYFLQNNNSLLMCTQESVDVSLTITSLKIVCLNYISANNFSTSNVKLQAITAIGNNVIQMTMFDNFVS